MCGITGFWQSDGGFGSPDSATALEAVDVVTRMASAIAHRGPDDSGAWIDAEVGLALGHRRLSIIDLSPQGHQPMVSSDGRFVVVYNGEVYNFAALRSEMIGRGASFHGSSDTEVLLWVVREYGLQQAVERLNGMFAFALYDRRDRELHLVRDRLGEKPLYWGWAGESLLFGSELKALTRHPAWRGEVDRDALALFLRYQYVPAPYSIYRGVWKLAPGTIATFRRGAAGHHPEMHTYWSVESALERGRADPFQGSADEATDELEELLRSVVRDEMTSDVPLGAFLSGGLDSSLIVALMQSQSDRNTRTFTIGFQDERFNEAHHAAAVADHLGTDHTELYVTSDEVLAVVPRLPLVFDEPFGDSSQVPTILVSEMARRHVSVSLSGDGGDELFAGYSRYAATGSLWRRTRRVPPSLRAVAGRWLDRESVPRTGAGYRRKRFGRFLAARSEVEFYHARMAHWQNPGDLALGARLPATPFDEPAPGSLNAQSSHDRLLMTMMYLDQRTYLPDDILTKVDRAAMAASLETRAPYMDHRVVELAWRLPLSMKVRDGSPKWLLKRLTDRFIPATLMDRPKQGFALPFGQWLRGPLRDWAEALLDERRLSEQGFLDPKPVQARWKQHVTGAWDWRIVLWDVLMFQAWLECHEPGANTPIGVRSNVERYLQS